MQKASGAGGGWRQPADTDDVNRNPSLESETTLSPHDKLVYMANQIAKFFRAEGEDKAIVGTADHLARFWDPRMRAVIIAHLDAGGAGLDPIAKRAVDRLKQMASGGA